MKIAVIDMGTNTFHLLIVKVDGEDFDVVFREKAAVKIGEKGINKGMITPEAQERALDTLMRFREIIDSNKVDQVFATATSAIRNAKNGLQLVDKIKEATGIETRVITGLQEAEYIYYGVKKALDIGPEPALIMDIGGGSIEFIIGTNSDILWKESFEIGGQRMLEQFQNNDPILASEIDALRGYLESHLQKLVSACQQHQPRTLIGSSGTFDTLSDIYRLANDLTKNESATEYPLTLDSFDDTLEQVVRKDRAQRLDIPGMIPLRVDMIVVACVLVDYVIKKLDLKKVRVSAYALKEGVLLSTIHSLQALNKSTES